MAPLLLWTSTILHLDIAKTTRCQYEFDLYLSFEPAKRIESFYYNAVSTSNQIFSLFTRIDVSSSQVISITILGHVDSQQHQSLFRGFLHSVAIKNNKYSGYHEFHDTHGILRKIR